MSGKSGGVRRGQSVDSTQSADEGLAEFRDRLLKLIDVEALVLFGSRARGEALPSSDYDVAAVSSDFAGKNPFERMAVAQKAWPAGVGPVEFVCFTPEEFERGRGLIIWDILDDGVPLVDRGVFRRKKQELERLIAEGGLQRIPGGWKAAV